MQSYQQFRAYTYNNQLILETGMRQLYEENKIPENSTIQFRTDVLGILSGRLQFFFPNTKFAFHSAFPPRINRANLGIHDSLWYFLDPITNTFSGPCTAEQIHRLYRQKKVDDDTLIQNASDIEYKKKTIGESGCLKKFLIPATPIRNTIARAKENLAQAIEIQGRRRSGLMDSNEVYDHSDYLHHNFRFPKDYGALSQTHRRLGDIQNEFSASDVSTVEYRSSSSIKPSFTALSSNKIHSSSHLAFEKNEGNDMLRKQNQPTAFSLTINDRYGTQSVPPGMSSSELQMRFPKERIYYFDGINHPLTEPEMNRFIVNVKGTARIILSADGLPPIVSTVGEMFPEGCSNTIPLLKTTEVGMLWYFLEKSETIGPCKSSDMLAWVDAQLIHSETFVKSASSLADFCPLKDLFPDGNQMFLIEPIEYKSRFH